MINKNDFSLRSNRKKAINDSLKNCDSDKAKIKILVDRILELEDRLNVLQSDYIFLYRSKYVDLCVPVPF